MRFLLPVLCLLVVGVLLTACSSGPHSSLIQTAADFLMRDRFADMPPAENGTQPIQTLKVRMRDGVLLATNIYLPKGEGPWPVILVRDPYGFAQYLSCAVFVRYGYACVHQDVRGRGNSGGDWYPFVNERDDGLDTIQWILTQPWQNRKIALWGESYLGIDQWAMADALPPEVKTLYAGVSHGDVYQTTYHNGMFVEGVIGVWSQTQFAPWYKQFLSATADWKKEFPGQFPALGADKDAFGAAWPAYHDYLEHPEKDDPYWQAPRYQAMRDAYKGVRVPVFMLGRNNDFFLQGMLETYKNLPTRDESVFYLAPGDHGGGATGDLKVDHPHSRYFADILAWFDHFLKGKPLPPELKPGYTVYINGADRWQHYDHWPATEPLILHLGRLSEGHRCDGGDLGDKAEGLQAVSYTYDPHNPVPTRGGSFLLSGDVAPPAVQDQKNDLCSRPDVLSFSSQALPQSTLIAGGVRVKLLVSSDAADTAFTVKLSEHFADGRVYNIRDDISTLSLRNGATKRMEYRPGDRVEVDFNLIPVAWQLQAGSRLRLDISSSNFPEFNPHPNKAGLWSAVTEPAIAHQTIYSGEVEIPISPNK